MAAQSITTDLQTINTAEVGTLTSWTALGGGQSGLAEETDFAVQGSTSISKQVKQETKGMHANFGSQINLGTANHVYTWLYATTPGTTDTRANGGIRVTIGTADGARNEYYVNGKDGYRYGGWRCYPVQYSQTPDAVVGSAGANPQYFGGILSNVLNVRGINFGVDVIRYGTGIDATGGGSPDPDITFADIAAENDLQANAWGVCQGTDSGVSLQGELRLGTDDSSTVTVFNDADKVLTNSNKNPSDVNQKTSATFTGLTLRGSQTDVTFTGVTFLSLDATDPGFIDCDTATNSATALFDGCVFQGWGSIGLSSTATMDGCKFTTCAALIVNGGSVDNCTFNQCATVAAGTSMEQVQGCTFNAPGSAHALQTDISAGTYSLVGNNFNGYNAANNQADSAINFTASSGTITVNVSGGTIPSYSTAGATIIMQSSSTLTLSGLQPNTEVRVYEAGTTNEVGGVENSGITEVFAIATGSVDIVLHNLAYLNQRLTNVDTSSDLNLPVQQTIDRQYQAYDE